MFFLATTVSTSAIILGVIMIITAILLVIAVLMQNGKSHGLSGTIAGGAETFFGKNNKTDSLEKKLNLFTLIATVLFVVVSLVAYILFVRGII